MSELFSFHLAFPVDDLAGAREFCGRVMGCPEGRSSAERIDSDFYRHQIVAHLAPSAIAGGARNAVALKGFADQNSLFATS